jgi:hypothetical protein
LAWNGITWRYVAAGRRHGLSIVCRTKDDCSLVD